MRVGFTGTRNGMTSLQKSSFKSVLADRFPVKIFNEFHHGDCVGADEEADVIVRSRCNGVGVVVHPPIKHEYRAHCERKGAIAVRRTNSYLDRNHDIVDECDVLVACPGGEETRRSGTWATVRYARKTGKPVFIVYPDGRVVEG